MTCSIKGSPSGKGLAPSPWMWSYSLVLYFCRIALRCFGMLLTPACIRKTVSGPYPEKDSLSSNLQHHPTFESCVNLFIWAFTWHVKHQVIQKSAQNLSFPTSPNSSPTPKLLHLTWLQIFILHLLGTFGTAAHAELPQGAPPIDQARCQWYVWPPGVVRGGKWQLSSDGNMKLTWK